MAAAYLLDIGDQGAIRTKSATCLARSRVFGRRRINGTIPDSRAAWKSADPLRELRAQRHCDDGAKGLTPDRKHTSL